MNYLVDTNVVLDIALDRDNYFKDASEIFYMTENKNIRLYISTSTITDLYFIIK
ncbi:MAG: PIN domain-containing protein [Saprospiraceae bacterium]|nr:PIN domain-containing protein [Saprospiraceae bacterium]